MTMKSISKKPVPGSGFDSHLLNIEETWWVRDHPFNARCVMVKKKIKEVNDAENRLEKLRAELDLAVSTMNLERQDA